MIIYYAFILFNIACVYYDDTESKKNFPWLAAMQFTP